MTKDKHFLRKLTTLALASVLALGGLGVQTAGAQTSLLSNSGFETYTGANGVADGWMLFLPATGTADAEVLSQAGQAGTNAQQLTASGMQTDSYADVYQQLDVAANKHYAVEGYFDVEALNNAYLQLYIDYYDANGDVIGSSFTNRYTLTDGYLKLENYRITPPRTQKMIVRALIRATGDDASGSVLLDDLTVREIAPALANTGFESYTATLDGQADAWQSWHDVGSTADYDVVPGQGVSGSQAQRVTGTNMPNYGIVEVYQDLAATPETSYTASGLFNVTELNEAEVQLYVTNFDANGATLNSQAVRRTDVTNGYERIESQWVTPPGSAYCRVYALLKGNANGASGVFWVDDLQAAPTMRDLIPTMKANTDPLGEVTVSSALAGAEGYKAFDDDRSTYWSATKSYTQHVQYNFGTKTAVTQYAITPVSAATAPKNWTLIASDNGSSWVTIDSRTLITDWQAGTAKTFTLTTPGVYQYYRLAVSSNNGGLNHEVAEWELFGSYARPSTPTEFKNPMNGDGYVSLTWKALNGVKGYNLYQNGVKVNQSPILGTSYTVRGLTNNQPYSFGLSAVNDAGESDLSPELQAIPYAQSAVPVMTSNTSASIQITASLAEPGHDGYLAFDQNEGTYWQASKSYSEYIQVKFPTLTKVGGLALKPVSASSTPKTMTLYGITAENKQVQIAQFLKMTDWQAGQYRFLFFNNNTAYLGYRIYFDYSNGDNYKISEIHLIGTN